MNTNNQEKTRRSAPFVVLALLLCLTVPLMAVPASAAEIYDLSNVNGYSYFSNTGVPFDAGSFPLTQKFTINMKYGSSGDANGSYNLITIYLPDSFVEGDNFNFDFVIPNFTFTTEVEALNPRFTLSFKSGGTGIKNHFLNFYFYQDGTHELVENMTGIYDQPVTPFFSEYNYSVSTQGERSVLSVSGVYSAVSPVILLRVVTDYVTGTPGDVFSYTLDYSFNSYQDLKFSTGPLKVSPYEQGVKTGLASLGELVTALFTPSGSLFPLSVSVGLCVGIAVVNWCVKRKRMAY